MVIAHHLIWTAYGTWLPNDPRGSGSHSVYAPAIAELGESHYGRRQTQPARQVIRQFYLEAATALQFPVIRFAPGQISAIAEAFADVIDEHHYTCYACAIMPDHVHLVIRKHKYDGGEIIRHFQCSSSALLVVRGLVPQEHPVWTKNGWKVYLNSPAEVRQRIRYVAQNPIKQRLPAQHWPFVAQYDNWPFHKKLNRKREFET